MAENKKILKLPKRMINTVLTNNFVSDFEFNEQDHIAPGVYNGRNNLTNEKVVIKKTLLDDLVNRSEEEDKNEEKEPLKPVSMAMDILTVLEEVKAISHENIIKIYYSGIDADSKEIYEVMEKCDGDLSGLISPNIPNFKEEDAIDVIYQMAQALALLHKKGISHRDIKPENFFYKIVNGKKIYKLGDFGFACKKEKQKSKLGTKYHVAPEIVLKDVEYSNKVDVFSLGIALHRMLFQGAVPFDQPREMERGFRKNNKVYSTVNNTVMALLDNMLKIDPKDRFDIEKVIEHCEKLLNKKEEHLYIEDYLQKGSLNTNKLNFLTNTPEFRGVNINIDVQELAASGITDSNMKEFADSLSSLYKSTKCNQYKSIDINFLAQNLNCEHLLSLPAKIDRLTSITFDFNVYQFGVDNNSVKSLASSINSCDQLEELFLQVSNTGGGKNNCQTDGFESIVNSLSNKQKLSKLKLNFSGENIEITNNGFKSLGLMLAKLSKLTQLELSFSNGPSACNNEGMKTITEGIYRQKDMSHLSLNFSGKNHDIQKDGLIGLFTKLGKSIPNKPTDQDIKNYDKLETLELLFSSGDGGKNCCSDGEFIALLGQIGFLKKLKKLTLDFSGECHSIKTNGLKKFNETLQHLKDNLKIIEVDLWGKNNCFDETTIKEMYQDLMNYKQNGVVINITLPEASQPKNCESNFAEYKDHIIVRYRQLLIGC